MPAPLGCLESPVTEVARNATATAVEAAFRSHMANRGDAIREMLQRIVCHRTERDVLAAHYSDGTGPC